MGKTKLPLLKQNRTILSEKLKESLSSVLPVTGIVFLLCFSISPVPNSLLMGFVLGALLLILGMGLFTLGTDLAMTPIGSHVGSAVTKSRRVWLIILVSLLVGIFITMSEPDLQVLAEQVPGIPNMVLIVAVAIGVGVFLVVAMLRMLLRVKLSHLLIGIYVFVFLLARFVPQEFLSVAFDSGGVTTGPVTVPFIMALGLGLSAVGHSDRSESDSFGLIALCSIGPILAVLVLGLLYSASTGSYTPLSIPEVDSTRDLWLQFSNEFPAYAREVLLALAPIVAFFLIFQAVFLRLRRKHLAKILVGLFYTFVGLTLFLTGVNVGFMPAGYSIGSQLAAGGWPWLLVPIGMLIGYFIVKAEPAVLVLNRQVEDVTDGAISEGMMMFGLSAGMAISVGLSMTRVLTGISLVWFLVPGYALALGLSFAVPKIFTSIAFDSGGVASGPMTATFLLSFAMGACDATGGNVLTDAFGIVAMVAMTPLIIIQLIGLLYRIKTARAGRAAPQESADEVIDLSQEVEL